MSSRRHFLSQAATMGAALSTSTIFASEPYESSSAAGNPVFTHEVTLNGSWHFRLDPNEKGENGHWYRNQDSSSDWREVHVPHTWQISPDSAEYAGVAWYRRLFDVPENWKTQTILI